MNKREIVKIPVEDYPGGNFKKKEWGILAKNHKKILLLTFFELGGKRKPEATYRTFISEDEYITQDLHVSNVKWLTGRVDNVLPIHWWRNEESEYVFLGKSRSIYENRFGKIEDMRRWYVPMLKYQNAILDQKRTERYRKELTYSRSVQKLVPKMPEGVTKWVQETVMEEYHYLTYRPEKKKQTIGYCSCCENYVQIEKKVTRGEKGECPSCGRRIVFMPPSAQLNGPTIFGHHVPNLKWICVFQKINGGFVARFLECFARFQKDKETLKTSIAYTIWESARLFFRDGRFEWYEFTEYKQSGINELVKDSDTMNCFDSVVYTRNLPKVFEGTPFQYCSIDIFQKKCGNHPIHAARYMTLFRDKPFLEFLVKIGMTNLLQNLTEYWGYGSAKIDEKAKTPYQMLGIPKEYFKTVARLNPNKEELGMIQAILKGRVDLKLEEVRRWIGMFGSGIDNIANVRKYGITPEKFMNYVDRQNGRPRNVMHDWFDYLGWMKALHRDIKDEYYLLPKNLQAAHDDMLEEYTKKEDKIKKERQKQLIKNIAKTLAEAERSGEYGMKTRKYMIVVPKDAQDIRREGEKQHHCVGTYVERVAKGETMILFVRKVKEPETPFYTMEWKNGKVVQCRGKRNAPMTEEVKAFVSAFEKMMNEKERAGA